MRRHHQGAGILARAAQQSLMVGRLLANVQDEAAMFGGTWDDGAPPFSSQRALMASDGARLRD